MAEFYFEVCYKKGKDNFHADALSRLITGSPTVEDDEDEIPFFLPEKVEENLYLDTIDLTATVDFIENDLDRADQVFDMAEKKIFV